MFGSLKYVSPQLWAAYVLFLVIVLMVTSMVSSLLAPAESCHCSPCRPDSNASIARLAVDDITFISVPRPLEKESQYRRMKLAISSWLAASASATVLLFINRTEFDPSGRFPTEIDRQFGAGRVNYAGGIRTDHSGVPYIHEWFIQGIRQSPSRYVCFINSDILLSEKWLSRVKQIFKAMENDRRLLLIGQRIDFDLESSEYNKLRFTQNNLLNDIDEMVQRSRHSDHSPYGIDSFTFRVDPPPFDVDMIPPYIMGRYNWDNWLVGWWNRICDTVTFNLDPPIYHMNHVRHSFDVNDSKVAINHHLKKANKDYFGSNYDTKWQVIEGNVVAKRHGKNRYELG
jgi:hypothetical protein